MKIGIYGDSYAYATTTNPVKWFELLAEKLENNEPVKKSWWPFFKKKESKPITTEKNQVSVYSKGGSSLFYTYQQFVKTNAEHDLNIVLVTGANRYPKTLRINGYDYVFTTESHIESLVKTIKTLSVTDMKALADVKAWFRASHSEFNVEMQELMLQKMETLHDNTIFYPCFSDSFTKERCEKMGLEHGVNEMHTLWYRQLELLGLSSDAPLDESENICGHLGPEFNEFFAEVLYKRIKTGKWDHSGLLDVTLKNPKEFYYK